MAERPEEIKARIESITELRAMVNTMRALAAGPARQGQAALPGMRAYSGMIGEALSTSIGLLPERHAGPPPSLAEQPPSGVVVFCAEHGFAGAFSRRMIDAVADQAAAGRQLFVVGTRGLAVAKERGLSPTWSTVMGSHLDGMIATAHRVTEYIYALFLAGGVSGVDLVYARPVSTESFQVERQSLLPVDLKRFPPKTRGSRPIIYLPAQKLLENIVGEYVFAQLAHAAMESFASENTVRLAMMTVARRHIEEKLTELGGEQQRVRQEEITSELLEVMTGAMER